MTSTRTLIFYIVDEMTAVSPILFRREDNPTLPHNRRSVFSYVPFDVWTVVFDYMVDEIPKRPTILPDSLIQPLASWMPPPASSMRPFCVPHNIYQISRGARTSQAQKCDYIDRYERRGLPAVLHVDCFSRQHLINYPEYLALYRFLDPAPWRSQFPETSTKLFSPAGLCLCALDWAIALCANSSDVRLTFPSTNEDDTRSPCRLIGEALRKGGARRLRRLDLRFDWDRAFDEDKQKMILAIPSLEEMFGVNVVMLAHGPSLKRLHLGSEEDFFTWNPSNIYSVLRACPLLVDVELVTVLGPGPSGWNELAELPIRLDRLIRLRVRDSLPRWAALRHSLLAPNLVHVDIDIISSHMGMATDNLDVWWDETIEISQFAAQSCPPSLLQSDRFATGLHFQRDMDERYQENYKTELWPEYMTLSLARRAEVLLDPEAHPSEPYFKFTERSVTTSTKAYTPAFRATKAPVRPPAWIFYTFWACALNGLNAASKGRNVTSQMKDLVARSDNLLPSPYDWQTLLLALPSVTRLYLSGIREMSHGLAHFVLALSIPDGRELAGDLLQEIHLPDWDWAAEPIPLDLINELITEERQYLLHQATWH